MTPTNTAANLSSVKKKKSEQQKKKYMFSFLYMNTVLVKLIHK